MIYGEISDHIFVYYISLAAIPFITRQADSVYSYKEGKELIDMVSIRKQLKTT